MKKLRFLLALWISKLSIVGMRLLGRNASYFPGKIALKLCPDFLGHLKMPKTVIAITGTNGKTTTSNLVTSILRANGYSVSNNDLGSNVQAGVATTLLHDATMSGKSKKDIAVLEVDERSSLLIYPYITPDYLVCTNIMRDSVKRNANTDFISYIISDKLPASTKLILNADDMICATIAQQCKNRTYFGVEADRPSQPVTPFIRDIVYCPFCGGELEDDYIRYNHIGRYHCRDCGYRSPDPDFAVTSIDADTFTVAHGEESSTFRLINDNIVNVYDYCAVTALLTSIGLNAGQIAKGFDSVEIVKSRYDQTRSGDLTITLQAGKGLNPVATARSYSYVGSCPGDKKCVIVTIDDKPENLHNSENVCWFFDCDYSGLADPSIDQLIFAGPRRLDHRLRCLMTGIPDEKIITCPDYKAAAKLVDLNKYNNIFIVYDIFRVDEAEAIRETLLKEQKEEL